MGFDGRVFGPSAGTLSPPPRFEMSTFSICKSIFALSFGFFGEGDSFIQILIEKNFHQMQHLVGGGGGWGLKTLSPAGPGLFILRFFSKTGKISTITRSHNTTLFKPFEINRSLYTSWFTYVLKKKSSWFLKWSKFVQNGLWEPFRTCKNSVIMACSGHSASKTKREGNSAKVAEQWKTGRLGLSRLPRFFTPPLVLHLLLFRFVLLNECLEQAALITKA